MHESEKLDEAKDFYRQMSEQYDDRTAFKRNLSAFLSAGGSVLQYARKEAETKVGGQHWYGNRVHGSQVLTFFKGKRNANIHDEPVRPTRYSQVTLGGVIAPRASLKFVHKDADGNVIQRGSSDSVQADSEVQRSRETVSISHRWIFNDWPGTEDVMTLCKQYIDELESFVKEGISQGFLSGV